MTSHRNDSSNSDRSNLYEDERLLLEVLMTDSPSGAHWLVSDERGTWSIFDRFERSLSPERAYQLIDAAAGLPLTAPKDDQFARAFWLLNLVVRVSDTTEVPPRLLEYASQIGERAAGNPHAQAAIEAIAKHYRRPGMFAAIQKP